MVSVIVAVSLSKSPFTSSTFATPSSTFSFTTVWPGSVLATPSSFSVTTGFLDFFLFIFSGLEVFSFSLLTTTVSPGSTFVTSSGFSVLTGSLNSSNFGFSVLATSSFASVSSVLELSVSAILREPFLFVVVFWFLQKL